MAMLKLLKCAYSMASLSVSAKILIMLCFGVGYYRFTFAVLLYFLVKALIRQDNNKNILNLIWVPLVAISLYFDIAYGAVLTLYEWERPYHAPLLFAVIDYTATKYINSLVEAISHGHVFSWCKLCGYENIKLTNKCNNCGGEFSPEKELADNDNGSSYKDRFFYKSIVFASERLNNYEVGNLGLDKDEKISGCINVAFINGIYINNVKTLCSHIVFTNRNIIFINKMKLHRGWRYRKKINLNDIDNVIAATKKIGMTDRKIVKVITSRGGYDFFLWVFDRSTSKHHEYVNYLKNICMNESSN